MSRELSYLKGSVVEPYHGVLLWNGVSVHLFSVGTWIGTCSAPGARMGRRGLV